MQIIDAYETNALAGVFIRMTWESYGQLLSTIDLETVLHPSLDQLQREEQLHQIACGRTAYLHRVTVSRTLTTLELKQGLAQVSLEKILS